MKLKVLVDNNTYVDEYYLGEPGASYYIEDEGTKILMDTGYSGVFADNAKKLGVDLKTLDVLVLSHGHNDHTGGLDRLFMELGQREITVVAHPSAFERKYYDGEDIGSPMKREEVERRCRLILTGEPLQISPHIKWMGQIPRITEFEPPRAIGEMEKNGERTPDFMEDDSALLFEGEQGLAVITGCSHSGICNILEHAQKLGGNKNVQGLIGGFHLFRDGSARTKGTVDYLKGLGISELYPCHCTSFAVRAAIHRETPVREVGVGMELEWR